MADLMFDADELQRLGEFALEEYHKWKGRSLRARRRMLRYHPLFLAFRFRQSRRILERITRFYRKAMMAADLADHWLRRALEVRQREILLTRRHLKLLQDQPKGNPDVLH